MDSLDRFGTVAAEIAMRAFVEYARRVKMPVDAGEAVAALRRVVREKLPQALADAREAFETGMTAVAEATFMASMRIAGVEAAKQCRR